MDFSDIFCSCDTPTLDEDCGCGRCHGCDKREPQDSLMIDNMAYLIDELSDFTKKFGRDKALEITRIIRKKISNKLDDGEET